MKVFQDYTLLEELDGTRWAKVYRAEKTEHSAPVIIKILRTRTPSVSNIARFKQEYEAIRAIDHEGVVQVLEIIEHQDKFAIVTQDIIHPSVETYFETHQFDLPFFLSVGISIAQTLAVLHQNEITHGEIKPSHLYIDEARKTVKISDFGAITILTRKNSEIYRPDVIQRGLAYISPEQTGRMNRWVDYRTDMYSLGIVFYEMLTGKIPFISEDPMELIYSHLAVAPVPPEELNPDIPKAVSDIVMKLLHKNAEERYQNALGLSADLDLCLKQFRKEATIQPFKPGGKDIPRRFNLPQKLYGRAKEIQILLASFEKVCKGMQQMILVNGFPGIGKSALVNEIHKPIVARKGFFITGKFEQYRKDVPYSAIIQAFRGMIRQILSQSDDRISQWKEKLQSALEPNGQVISNVISDIELVMGEQPEIPDLGPEETRNRFNMVFEKFISVFAKAEHPLVLFLDDLQWADSASLEMMKMLAASDEISHLLIIGSYRDDEVDEDHPLSVKLREINKLDINVVPIQVGPIQEIHVSQLIQDNLKGSEDKCMALGELVYKKTGGNPFFVNQFLKTLYDDRLIHLDSKAVWQWDYQKISDMQVTDNLVDLLVEKINKLEEKTRETLKLCACIGNRFDLEVIAYLEETTVEDTLKNLKEAIHEGLIDGSESLYFYHHDRIQEAAYSLLEEKQKSLIHYRVGKKAILDAIGKPLNGKLFYVADQLNAGVEWISNPDEKDQLAGYNFKAGKKAKTSAAYDNALEYYKTGLDILGGTCWEKQYALTLEAHAQIVEIYYLLGRIEQMEYTASFARSKTTSLLDETAFSATLIKAYTSQGKMDEALKEGIDMLARMGVDLPMEPNDARIFESLQKVMAGIGASTDEDLLNLPDMDNPQMLAAAEIIVEMTTAAYLFNRELSSLLWLEMMLIHLKYGIHPLAALAFVSYGVIMVVGLNDIHSGERFGKLAFRILEKYNNQTFMAPVLNTYNIMIRHWVEPAEASATAGLEVHRLAMETGRIDSAAFGLFLHDTYSLAVGTPLQQLDKIMAEHGRMIKKLNQEHIYGYHFLWRQMILNLMGKSKNPLRLAADGFDEETFEKTHLEKKDYTSLCIFYQIKCLLLFFFEEYEECFEYLKKAEQYQSNIRGLINSVHMVFFGAITRLAIYHRYPEEQQKEFMEVINANHSQLEHWKTFSPTNFSHRCKLIEAMKAQVAGDLMGAIELYDETISLCRGNGYEYDAGYATSLAGTFFIQQGKERIARLYLEEAYQSHIKMGRKALVNYLGAKYPFLKSDSQKTGSEFKAKEGHASRLLDMETVVKASQAISGEIVLGKLLKKMMQMVLENAGAQQGFMLLSENDALFVEAEFNSLDNNVSVLESVPIDQHGGFSSAVVQFVARTRKTIILDNACQEGDYTQDAYFKKNKAKSVLCQPIIGQGRLVGLLYLENNLATGVFTKRHLEVLRVISSQAAISIENAKLYSNLEQKVKERTQELEDAYEKIKQLANTDPLTQLSNRRDMMEKIELEKRRLSRNKSRAALVLSDIDNFKMVNDTFGHDCGDFVLKIVADTMKSMIRQQDMVARWGGEEFLFLLPKTGVEGAKVITDKVRQAICEKTLEFNDHTLSISMTFGVSSFDDPNADIDIYLKKADDALYKGKQTGKNRVVLSD